MAVASASIGLVGFSAVVHPKPLIVWNASASMPVGLYRVVSGAAKYSDLVLVLTPDTVKSLASRRGYLPAGVPLVKRIAAVTGDTVCASNRTVTINGTPAVRRLEADRSGRPLPRWRGCHRLERDEYFILGDAPDSFDSRYFGTIKRSRVIGRLIPLWID